MACRRAGAAALAAAALAAVWSFAEAAVGGGLAEAEAAPFGGVGPSGLSCTSVPDPEARAAWEDLRKLLAVLHSKTEETTLWAVFAHSEFGRWATTKMERHGKDIVTFDWLTPFHPQEECLVGRWSCWLLQRELLGASASYTSREQVVAELLLLSGANRSATAATVPAPLAALLLLSGGSGQSPPLPAWSEIFTSSWNFFAVVARCERALFAALGARGLLTPPGTKGAEGTAELEEAAEGIRAALGEGTDIGPTLAEKLTLLRSTEEALRNWTASMEKDGLGEAQRVWALLAFSERWKLFENLKDLQLPDVAVLRLPHAISHMEEYQAAEPPLAKATRWQQSTCGDFPHGELIHGAPRGLPSLAASASAPPASSPWRCGVAMRLMRRDHMVSNKVRSYSRLECPAEVLQVLWSHSWSEEGSECHVDEAAPSCKPMLYVDVGANLGDCTLAAAGLLPEGSFRGLALDADPRVVSLLNESLHLNGLSTPQSAGSFAEVRLAMLSDVTGLKTDVVLDKNIGVVVDSSGTAGDWVVPTSTLDEELSTLPGEVDLMSVVGNGDFELRILRGAQGLLQSQRIRCLLITCLMESCEEIRSLLSKHGYASEEREEWIAASPRSELDSSVPAGRICAPRQRLLE